jgi:hypothetical protein
VAYDAAVSDVNDRVLLANVVRARDFVPLMAHARGGGEVASADGIRFVVPVKTIHAGPNPKYADTQLVRFAAGVHHIPDAVGAVGELPMLEAKGVGHPEEGQNGAPMWPSIRLCSISHEKDRCLTSRWIVPSLASSLARLLPTYREGTDR